MPIPPRPEHVLDPRPYGGQTAVSAYITCNRGWILLLWSVLLFWSGFCHAESLDSLVGTENLWSLNQDQFQATAQQLPFRWTSNAKDSARAAGAGLTLFNLPVYEVVARFEAAKLKEISVSYFARGDAGELPKEQFEALVRNCADAVSKYTTTKFTPRGKDPNSAVKADGLLWSTPKGNFLLEYSFIKEVKTRDIPFRAEFVRLNLTAPERKTGITPIGGSLNRQRFNGPAHVKRDTSSGDVFVPDVPMVDQGQKGYCVVASTERVLRYYGISADANELAQVANSDAAAGTSVTAMIGSLKKLAGRFGVRVREIEEMDVKHILDMIRDYNRSAKRANRPELPDPGHHIDVGSMYRAINYDVLKDARTHREGDVAKFQRNVQASIDKGIPLMWSVMLGLKPDPGIPQGAGGHMRLIIGYNSKTNQILYSDSWGAGHELKRMPADEAWTITTGLTAVEPAS